MIIGNAMGLSQNTACKYMCELEEHQLISTENETIVTYSQAQAQQPSDYTICPIRKAVDHYHKQQFHRSQLDVERQKAQTRLSQLCAA